MFLSKYIPLCNEGQESYRYWVSQTLLTDEMKPLAEELKKELKGYAESPLLDSGLKSSTRWAR